MKSVTVVDKLVVLTPLDKKQLPGLSIGERLSYQFYKGKYLDVPLLFVKPKVTTETPRSLAITAQRMQEKFATPVVFILEEAPAYLRQRLIEKNVYFVVSNKYAFLPMILANARQRKSKPAKRLTPIAQYILLYHLQVRSVEGLSAQDLAEILPYSYSNVALGIVCLKDLGLCLQQLSGKKKLLHFTARGKALWDLASAFLINPVIKKVFCDQLLSQEHFPQCGINALAHYTMLSPDEERMLMMNSEKYKSLSQDNLLINSNEYDGNIMIETWKYPPITPAKFDSDWVDRLSLALTLQDDPDPRVEKEVERLINDTPWKD